MLFKVLKLAKNLEVKKCSKIAGKEEGGKEKVVS